MSKSGEPLQTNVADLLGAGRKITIQKAAELNGISVDTFKRHYRHLIKQVSTRRLVVSLSDAINLPPLDKTYHRLKKK